MVYEQRQRILESSVLLIHNNCDYRLTPRWLPFGLGQGYVMSLSATVTKRKPDYTISDLPINGQRNMCSWTCTTTDTGVSGD